MERQDSTHTKRVPRRLEEPLHSLPRNDEGRRIHEWVAADLIMLPELLIEEDFDMMIGIIDETEKCHSPRLDAEVLLQVFCRCEGGGFNAVDFPKLLEVRDLPVRQGEENVPPILLIFQKEILRMHPRHLGAQPCRFLTREDGGMIKALEGDAVTAKKMLNVHHTHTG